MTIKVFLVPVSPEGTNGDPKRFSLDRLLSGDQNYEAFSMVAEHIIENALSPEHIEHDAIRWVANAFKNILEGDDPAKAFGMGRERGRQPSSVLATKVQAYVELLTRDGITKNRAIQEAADRYHRDPRQIQRLLSGLYRFNFSENPSDQLRAISEIGLDIRNLGEL